MSIQAINWVLECSQSRGMARLVLISLANHANRYGAECRPGLATIQDEAGVGRATVLRALAELVEIGELLMIEGTAGRGNKSRFVMLMGRSPEEGAALFDDPEPAREKVRSGPNRSAEKVRPDGPISDDEKVRSGPIDESGKGPEKVQKRSAPRASPVHSTEPGTVNPSPLLSPQGESSAPAKTAPDYPPDFVLFRDAYPPGFRNAPDAVKVWHRLKVDDDLFVAIMAGLAAWVESDHWRVRKMIKGAEVWLRQRKWEEPPPASRPNEVGARRQLAVVVANGSTSAADQTRRRAEELRRKGH